MIYMNSNLKILFLDDNHTRHALFKTWCQDADHCYGYDDCVRLLRLARYDVVSLDHDLGEDDELCIPGITNKQKTGTDVAKFIATLVQKPNMAILHSYNPLGAEAMAAILHAANVKTMRVPFGFDKMIYSHLTELVKQ